MSQTEAIKTPILTYKHPEHENQVDLVGMMHIAEPVYYQTVQEFVDTRVADGAVVHYERSKIPTAQELSAAPPAVRRKVERVLGANREIYGMLGEIDGLVHQSKGLTYRDGWKNHDSTLLETVAGMNRLTVDGLCARVKLAKLAHRIMGPEEMQKILLEQLVDATSKEPKPAGFIETITSIGHKKHVILGRNAVALAAFDAELRNNPAQDLLLLWGARHLQGMNKDVKNRGFVQTHEQYLTAIQPR